MAIKRNKDEYQLCARSVDLISERIHEHLIAHKCDTKDALRFRLSVEEILLKWLEDSDESKTVTLETGLRWGRPYFRLQMRGEAIDPYDSAEESFGDYSAKLLEHMGIRPSYSYQHGINVVFAQIKRKSLNPLVSLLIAVLAAFAAGFAGLLLPDTLRTDVYTVLLSPVYNTFSGVLSIPILSFSSNSNSSIVFLLPYIIRRATSLAYSFPYIRSANSE